MENEKVLLEIPSIDGIKICASGEWITITQDCYGDDHSISIHTSQIKKVVDCLSDHIGIPAKP